MSESKNENNGNIDDDDDDEYLEDKLVLTIGTITLIHFILLSSHNNIEIIKVMLMIDAVVNIYHLLRKN